MNEFDKIIISKFIINIIHVTNKKWKTLGRLK